MSRPEVTYERDPETGGIIERFRQRGPRIKRRVLAKAGPLPEQFEQVETIETYPAEDAILDHPRAAGEAAKVDGQLSGEWPRESKLRERMAEAGYDVGTLAERAALPPLLIARLLDDRTVPTDSHREAIEAVLPSCFPERREPLSMAEQIQGASSTASAAGQAAEAERAERSRRNDARRREAERVAAERRERTARRRAELDTRLGKVLSRFERIQRRLDRQ